MLKHRGILSPLCTKVFMIDFAFHSNGNMRRFFAIGFFSIVLFFSFSTLAFACGPAHTTWGGNGSY